MSCCTIEKKTPLKKVLAELHKHFDEVIIENKGAYNLIVFRDKAKRENYDYIVWTSFKASKVVRNSYGRPSEDDSIIAICEEVLKWVDALKEPLKPKQTSLFGSTEAEELPKAPIGGSDKEWTAYNKEVDRIRRADAIQKLGFFDLLCIWRYVYYDIDFRKQIPSIQEVRELYKKALLVGKENPGRDHEWFWLDSPDYVFDKNGLSDTELITRLSSVRLFLAPYMDYSNGFVDNSFFVHETGPKVRYRFYLDGSRWGDSGHCDYDKKEMPDFSNIFDEAFLNWFRETFDIKRIDPITDEDTLKEGIESYLDTALWFKRDEYKWKVRINDFKNAKEFQKDLKAFLKQNGIESNGGSYGSTNDGYKIDINLDQKKLVITQEQQAREAIGYDIENVVLNDYENYIVYDLAENEIFQKAFELFKKEVSLFDFAM